MKNAGMTVTRFSNEDVIATSGEFYMYSNPAGVWLENKVTLDSGNTIISSYERSTLENGFDLYINQNARIYGGTNTSVILKKQNSQVYFNGITSEYEASDWEGYYTFGGENNGIFTFNFFGKYKQ